MARLDIERQNELEPKRMNYAIDQLEKLGFQLTIYDNTYLTFVFRGEVVKLYPYSGWHTGKSINDGRGIKKLLAQLKENQ